VRQLTHTCGGDKFTVVSKLPVRQLTLKLP